MLGRACAVARRVVHGFHRGGPLGIPTANLRVRGIQLPPDGVYAVRASVAGTRARGVANIGLKPTFGDLERTRRDPPARLRRRSLRPRLDVAFVARLRGEQKFPDVEALAGADPRRHRRGAAPS